MRKHSFIIALKKENRIEYSLNFNLEDILLNISKNVLILLVIFDKKRKKSSKTEDFLIKFI